VRGEDGIAIPDAEAAVKESEGVRADAVRQYLPTINGPAQVLFFLPTARSPLWRVTLSVLWNCLNLDFAARKRKARLSAAEKVISIFIEKEGYNVHRV
jgi:hypothetical protein